MVTNLTVLVQRDDGVVVYLNGTGIFTNNLPTGGPLSYLTNALSLVSGVDETTFYSQAVNPSLLVGGNNVLAAEIHQANASSSDIVFDLELDGRQVPTNQPPAVNAGPDQTVSLPASATLSGAVTDDTLPVLPGLLTWGWTKFSGPGTVTFANAGALNTPASFSTNGIYVLRLTASDGVLSASDDLVVTANPSLLPLRIESAVWSPGEAPGFRLTFSARAGVSYTVQYRDTLTTGDWLKLADVPVQSLTQSVLVSDPGAVNSPRRFYRIVTTDPASLPLRIESTAWSAGEPPGFRLAFTARAGLSYTVQYRDSLTSGTWLKLADVPVPGATQSVLISDAGVVNSPRRFYRVVTPAQP